MSNEKLNSSIVRVEMNNEKLNSAIARADDELDRLKDTCHDLYDRNKELQERIDKAIEYIEWNLDVNEEVIEYINFDGNFKKVLDILKGSDK